MVILPLPAALSVTVPAPAATLTPPTHADRGAHTHGCAELVIIRSGAATHFTCLGTHGLTPGDVLVLYGGCYHGYRDTRKLKLMNIWFDPPDCLPTEPAVRALTGFKRMFGFDAPAARRRGFFGHTRLLRDDFTRAKNCSGA